MAKEKIDIYLVFTSDHHQSEYVDDHFKTRAYLSGFTGSAGFMAITETRAILWADGRYYVQAAKQLEGSGIELFKYGLPQTQTLPEFLKENCREGMVAACDGRTISASYCEKLNDATGDRLRTDVDLFDEIWPDRPVMSHEAVYELPLSVCGKSRTDKLTELRKELDLVKASGYVLSDLSAIMWLFNVRGSDVTCNPVAFSYAYITKEDASLFVQDQVIDQALKSKLQAEGITVRSYEETESYFAGLSALTIALDHKQTNAKVDAILRANNRIVDVSDTKLIPKHIKNEAEIACARKYHELDAVAMIRFIRYIKDAVTKEMITECDAAAYIDRLRSETEGFRDLSFETICAYGPNGAIVHYAPEEESCATLEPKGFLLLDSGGQYEGATTDITRTIALGPLTVEEIRDFTAVLKGVIALASAKFLDGTSGNNLDILARGPIWDMGIDYRHGTGHGIGAFLNVHEGPQSIRYQIDKNTDSVKLLPGMITSDEPGIYIEGSHGIRTENELLCVPYLENEWGSFYAFETLTLVPIEKDAIDLSMLREDEKAWINRYHERVYEKIAPYLNEEERLWLQDATKEL